MPFATYIIYSPSKDRYYVGHAEDPEVRLIRDHNGEGHSSVSICVNLWFKIPRY